MSNNFFEHQVVPQNSATSPVENLAVEVSEAFTKVASKLGADTAIPSLTTILGNYILADLQYHGVTKSFQESFAVTKNTQEVVLEAIPQGTVSVAYTNKETSQVEYLTQKQSNQLFTNTKEFKVIGRVLTLSGNLSETSIVVSYTGLTPSFGEFALRPNVIKDTEGYLKPLVARYDKTYEVVFSEEIQKDIEKYSNTSLEDTSKIFVIARNDGEYINLPYLSVYATENKIVFTFDEVLEQEYEVLIYVMNTTVETILTAIYKEVTTHTHTKNEATASIDHKHLVNRYINTDSIFYKENNTPNYEHPQYLNREGYNSSITSAYENSLLGDLFLASTISSTDQNYKTLIKNSVKILFGEPVAGSKLYFDTNLQSLNLLSGANLNGLNIAVAVGKKALSINGENSYLVEEEDGLSLTSKGDKLTLKQGTLVAEGLSSNVATIDSITLTKSIQGNVVGEVDSDIIEYTYKDPETKGTVVYNIDTVYKSTSLEGGSIVSMDLTGSLKTSEKSSLYNSEGNFTFSLDTSNLVVDLRSGIKSSLKIGYEDRSQKIYVSDYLGQTSTEADSNMYVESPLNSSIYLLNSTESAYSKGSTTYSFQKTLEGAKRIDSLKEWLRASLYTGDLTSYSISLNTSDAESRHGLKIGETRISVIGSDLDCPEGTTLVESSDSVHFIKPIQDTEVECSSINYQEVNTGSLQVFGNLAVDTDITALGNTTISGTVSASNFIASGKTTLSDLSVSGSALFTGETSYVGSVSVKNSLDVTGTVTLKGSLSAVDGSFSKYVNVGETLTVAGQSFFNDSVIIQGTLYTSEDFTTQGKLNAGSIKTGDLDSGTIRAQGSLAVVGSAVIEGSGSFSGALSTNSSLTVTGNTDVAGDLTANSLYAIADTTLMGRVTIDGAVQISTESFTLGSSNASLLLYGNLQVSGSNATFASNMNVQGDLSVNGAVKLSDTVTISSQLTVSSIIANSTVNILGNLTGSSADFSRKVYLQDGFKALGSSEFTKISGTEVSAETVNTDNAYIKNSLSMGPEAVVSAFHIEASKFTQKDPSLTTTFAGEAEFNNLVKVSSTGIVIGNPDIQTTRNTSGVYISDNTITLGNNSTIKAVKIFANKGVPSNGNRDLNAGFCFTSDLAQGGEDGDTGIFATTGSGSGLDGSNIEVWIDNSKKYIFYQEEVAFNANVATYGKAVVTLDMLQAMQSSLERKIASGTSSAGAAAWPVGSLYHTTNDANPYALFGFGTWVRYAPGRVLVGKVTGVVTEQGGVMTDGIVAPSGWALSKTGTTYGDFVHTLTLNETPSHVHLFSDYFYPENQNSIPTANVTTNPIPGAYGSNRTDQDNPTVAYHDHNTYAAGGGLPHNNVQPSVVVNIWNRLA